MFTSRDPLGYVDSYDVWMYVGGNPFALVDPWGMGRTESASDADDNRLARIVVEELINENPDSRWWLEPTALLVLDGPKDVDWIDEANSLLASLANPQDLQLYIDAEFYLLAAQNSTEAPVNTARYWRDVWSELDAARKEDPADIALAAAEHHAYVRLAATDGPGLVMVYTAATALYTIGKVFFAPLDLAADSLHLTVPPSTIMRADPDVPFTAPNLGVDAYTLGATIDHVMESIE